jgi:hypothetical protein
VTCRRREGGREGGREGESQPAKHKTHPGVKLRTRDGNLSKKGGREGGEKEKE